MTTIPDAVSARALGAHLGIAERTVRDLTSRGVLTRHKGGYAFGPTVRSYINHKTGAAAADGRQVRQRLLAARARKLEIDIAEREGQLMETELVLATINLLIGPIQSELFSVPPRVSNDLEVRRRCEDEIRLVLDGLADRCTTASETIKRGGDPYAVMFGDDQEENDDDGNGNENRTIPAGGATAPPNGS